MTLYVFYLYTHVHRLPQAVHGVSVGLDVAHAQSRHLDTDTFIHQNDKSVVLLNGDVGLTFWMVPLRLRIIISTR